jgi:hypothetical protein
MFLHPSRAEFCAVDTAAMVSSWDWEERPRWITHKDAA